MSALTPSLSQDGISTSANPSHSATQTNGECGSLLCECGEFRMNDLADMTHYAQALAVLWPVKATLAAIATWLGTEPQLIYWLVGAWAADWFFGLWEAFRRRKFSCRVFKRGALKIPSYGLCIILVYGADACIELASHINLPILEGFIAYLAIQESISVTGHAMRIGFLIPPIVRRILTRGKGKVEQQIDNILDDEKKD